MKMSLFIKILQINLLRIDNFVFEFAAKLLCTMDFIIAIILNLKESDQVSRIRNYIGMKNVWGQSHSGLLKKIYNLATWEVQAGAKVYCWVVKEEKKRFIDFCSESILLCGCKIFLIML